jgi:cell division protein FtsZ
VLINVAGSSGLTLDQFADACSLIFEATKNEEVHMSYGLVHDEALGDEVKVTVIATGFTRESSIPLSPPRTERAIQVPAPISVPRFEPETVDVPNEEMMVDDSVAAPPAVTPPPAAPKSDADPFDDIDTPAFLRRERKLFS